jgi:hypothetical protein
LAGGLPSSQGGFTDETTQAVFAFHTDSASLDEGSIVYLSEIVFLPRSARLRKKRPRWIRAPKTRSFLPLSRLNYWHFGSLRDERQIIGIVVGRIVLTVTIDCSEDSRLGAVSHHLEHVANSGHEAVDQADAERSVERGAAGDEQLIEGVSASPTQLDGKNARPPLVVIAGNGKNPGRADPTRIDLASARDVNRAGDDAGTGECAALEGERLVNADAQVTSVKHSFSRTLDEAVAVKEVQSSGLHLDCTRVDQKDTGLYAGEACTSRLYEGALVIERTPVTSQIRIPLNVKGGSGQVVEDCAIVELEAARAGKGSWTHIV